MYKIIYMKADFEPWWQFEGWESMIVSTKSFDQEEQFTAELKNMLKEFREKYTHEKVKDDKYYAFWSEDEQEYCDACDDISQIFHGIIIEK